MKLPFSPRTAKQRIKATLKPLAQHAAPKRIDLAPSLWNLSRDAHGVLALHGIPLPDLLQRYGSPLHIVDAHKLDQNIADFHAAAPGGQRCEVYYSYKTNPVPGVLQHMHRRGIGAEVISPYELWLALQLGVAPEEIVYNGPAKSPQSLRMAMEREIGLININHCEEIASLAEMARALHKRPRVGVRVTAGGSWNGQFGTPAGDAALHTFAAALAEPDLHVVALHAHSGYELASAAQAHHHIAQVLAFCDELHTRLGLNLEIIDLGGSLACPTTRHLTPRELRLNTAFGCDLVPRPPQQVLSIRNYVALATTLVHDYYRRAGRPTPRIFVEPGRAMTANTQMLLCHVLTTKAAGDLTYAVLDAGINVADAVRNEYHQLFAVGPARTTQRRAYRLAGPICTPMDVLYQHWELPELRPGDTLAIMDAGAYFVPFATSFSFPQPAIAMVENGEHRLLRRAERFEDQIALDHLHDAQERAFAKLDAWVGLDR